MQHNICMVCDFFYPNVGGVESHIYQLSQCLMNRGHKVIIVTHSYNDRTGVRYMTNGMKVYYLPLYVIYNQCTLPTLFTTFPILRYILIREQINIVHGHSAFSALALETIIHARVLGIKTVFTDHSLFGFSDASAIITNILLGMTLSVCNRVICVSHTGKENTSLRANVKPETITVIPNAVDNDIFIPDFNKIPNRSKITIVVISRLVYRKGIDLLAKLIPIICEKYSNTEFIIGGDGPKRAMLNDVVKRNKLEDRVQLLGAVKYDQVRSILIKGDIFLNSSLTEAFCIAIVEAVSCGLQVVTTNVGGIPEVLPSDLIWLGEPTVQGLVSALEKAIKDRELSNIVCPLEAHNRIRQYYQWPDIAKRTEVIYNSLVDNSGSIFRVDKTDSYVNGLNNDENDLNLVNINNNIEFHNLKNRKLKNFDKSFNLNNQINDLNSLNHISSRYRISSKQINNDNLTAKKVLYENQIQFIDLNYLRENQDKTGIKQLIRQCLNSSWFFGLFLLFLLYIEFLMKLFYDFWNPKSQIDICPTTITTTPNQIRNTIEENNTKVLKITKHQFTKSCLNCDLYVEPIDKQLSRLMNIKQLSQLLLNSTNSFYLTKYLNSIDLLNHDHLLQQYQYSTISDLKTSELINHFDMKQLTDMINFHNDQPKTNQIDINQFNKIEQTAIKSSVNELKNYQMTANELDSIKSSIENDDDDDELIEKSIDSIDNRTTIQFEDDEQDKSSSTENTSGYNTSNSIDSDLNSDISNSDNNSTSSQSDLGLVENFIKSSDDYLIGNIEPISINNPLKKKSTNHLNKHLNVLLNNHKNSQLNEQHSNDLMMNVQMKQIDSSSILNSQLVNPRKKKRKIRSTMNSLNSLISSLGLNTQNRAKDGKKLSKLHLKNENFKLLRPNDEPALVQPIK